MTYKEIKAKHQATYNKIFDDCGVFWAFSTEQFKEGLAKTKLAEGEKLVDIGAGGYLPKSKLEKFISETKEADKLKEKELREAKEARDEAILYELKNHECFYTGEIDDVVEIFKGIYSPADILRVFKVQKALCTDF